MARTVVQTDMTGIIMWYYPAKWAILLVWCDVTCQCRLCQTKTVLCQWQLPLNSTTVCPCGWLLCRQCIVTTCRHKCVKMFILSVFEFLQENFRTEAPLKTGLGKAIYDTSEGLPKRKYLNVLYNLVSFGKLRKCWINSWVCFAAQYLPIVSTAFFCVQQ